MPIPGAPEITAVHGRRLLARAEEVGRLADRLDRLAGHLDLDGGWEGPASDRAAEVVGRVPDTLRSVADRYAGAGRALVAFASRHADAQAGVAAAMREHDEAVDDRTRWDLRIDAETARAQPDADWLGMLRRWRLEAAERVLLSERRYAAAWHDFHVADDLCADSLDATAGLDDLGDPVVYRGLTRIADAAGSAALELGIAGTVLRGSGPWGVGLSLASLVSGAVQVGATATVKVVWGDGDWTSTGVNAAWLTVGATGISAGRGSVLRLHEARHGARGPKPVLERLGAGARDLGRTPFGASPGVPVARGGVAGAGTSGDLAHPALLAARRTIGVDAYRSAGRQGTGAIALKVSSDAVEAASTASAAAVLRRPTPRAAPPVVGQAPGGRATGGEVPRHELGGPASRAR
jgi:hypothetical protein